MAEQEDDHVKANTNPSTEPKPASKRPKPTLTCVVCGDDALGNRKSFFSLLKPMFIFRLQFRCYFM